MKQIPAKFVEDFDSIQPANLTDGELNTIKDFIDLTRDIQETKQWFDIFYFNLQCLLNSFTLYTDDTVEKMPNCPKCDSESIALNALVINLISSANTFVEMLRTRATKWFEKDENDKCKFNIYASNIYEKSFNYRVLINLRNFAQHRDLPVSFNEGRYSFDAFQILSVTHFSLNKKLVSDMNNFLSNFNPNEGVKCLALTATIADFVVKVIDIYREFLSCFKEPVSFSYNKIKKMIKSKPSIICNTHQDFKGCIIYLDGDMYHTFDPKANPNKMIAGFAKYIAEILKDEQAAFDELFPKSIPSTKKELK